MSKAFGEQNPGQGEEPTGWSTWSNGAGGTPVISGDANWGKLNLSASGAEGRSAVYDLGTIASRMFTLTEHRYGSGSVDGPVLQIRGSVNSFTQDAAVPVWEEYTAPIVRSWRYVQIGETSLADFDQSSGTLEVEV